MTKITSGLIEHDPSFEYMNYIDKLQKTISIDFFNKANSNYAIINLKLWIVLIIIFFLSFFILYIIFLSRKKFQYKEIIAFFISLFITFLFFVFL